VPEVERGFNMSWQSVPCLVNLVGQSIAKRFILLAEKLNSERGLDWVLADEVA
jgi:enoyl-CoA hydratase/carnithine racemase